MFRTSPSTPADVFQYSTFGRWLQINSTIKCAELTGRWKRPYSDAAATLEEMTHTDGAYWVYKSIHPITEPEFRSQNLLNGKQPSVFLPSGFQKCQSVSLSAVGDLFYSDNLAFSKDRLFEKVADLIFESDISFANLESPITTQPLRKEIIGNRDAPVECCSIEQSAILTQHENKRFTILNTANNHICDMGAEGLDTTQKVLEQRNIVNIGTCLSPKEQERAQIIEMCGVKFGFVASTFGLNGHKLSQDVLGRVNSSQLLSKFVESDLRLVKQQIDHCKIQGCDFVIVSMHWGYEFEFFPRQRQIELAHELVEQGADVILCHHPHVIQPVEYYQTERDSGRIAVIAHSLGTLTWGFMAPHLVLSMVLNITIAKGKIGDKNVSYVESVEVSPLIRTTTNIDGQLVTQLQRLDKFTSYANSSSSRLRQITHYANLVLGKNWQANVKAG